MGKYIGQYRDNGKESGNYYLGLRVLGLFHEQSASAR